MGIEEIDLTGDAPVVAPSRKRKAKDISRGPSSSFASSSRTGLISSQTIDLTGNNNEEDEYIARLIEKSKRKRKPKECEANELSQKSKQMEKGKKKSGEGNDEEKRLKRYAFNLDHGIRSTIDLYEGTVHKCPERSLVSWSGLLLKGMSLGIFTTHTTCTHSSCDYFLHFSFSSSILPYRTSDQSLT
jgi:hypothetical protein